MKITRREKVFGPGRAVPLDRNAKARIMAYARAWSARHKQPRQHRGPITRAFPEVLKALLFGFQMFLDCWRLRRECVRKFLALLPSDSAVRAQAVP